MCNHSNVHFTCNHSNVNFTCNHSLFLLKQADLDMIRSNKMCTWHNQIKIYRMRRDLRPLKSVIWNTNQLCSCSFAGPLLPHSTPRFVEPRQHHAYSSSSTSSSTSRSLVQLLSLEHTALAGAASTCGGALSGGFTSSLCCTCVCTSSRTAGGNLEQLIDARISWFLLAACVYVRVRTASGNLEHLTDAMPWLYWLHVCVLCVHSC